MMKSILILLIILLALIVKCSATTVAYDGRNLACDSRITTNYKVGNEWKPCKIKDDAIKYKCVSNIIFCCSGNIYKFDWFILNYLQKLLVEHPDDPCNNIYNVPHLDFDLEDLEIMVIHKAKPGVVDIWPASVDTNKGTAIMTPPVVIGSGGPYAISAMKQGCTAAESVEFAENKDLYSGGPIQGGGVPPF